VRFRAAVQLHCRIDDGQHDADHHIHKRVLLSLSCAEAKAALSRLPEKPIKPIKSSEPGRVILIVSIPVTVTALVRLEEKKSDHDHHDARQGEFLLNGQIKQIDIHFPRFLRTSFRLADGVPHLRIRLDILELQ
jgi:hypothetical protein